MWWGLVLYGLVSALALSTQAPPAAEALTAAFAAAGLPVTDVVVYTEETDPNRLLGRPHQYIAKASWRDARVERPGAPGTRTGGTVEVFATVEAREARQRFLDGVSRTPLLAQYIYGRGLILVRLTHALTPSQAAEYEAVLAAWGGP